MATTAEGVETEEQLERLRERRLHRGSGLSVQPAGTGGSGAAPAATARSSEESGGLISRLLNPATPGSIQLVTYVRGRVSCDRPIGDERRMPATHAALPDRLRDVEHLEDVMTDAVGGPDRRARQAARRPHHSRRRRQDRADAGAARQARGAGQARRRRGPLQRTGPARSSSPPPASNASRPISSTASRSTRCRSSPTWCSWPAASSAHPATRT